MTCASSPAVSMANWRTFRRAKMPDKSGEKEELAQLIRKTMVEYKLMGEDALARVAAGRIQAAGYRKQDPPC